MLDIARKRLEPFKDRLELRLSDGGVTFDFPDMSFDRYVASYVLDLLSGEKIARAIAEAHRILAPEGKLCVTALTEGKGPLGRIVSSTWRKLFNLKPSLVGGCRPIRLCDYLEPERWTVIMSEVVSSFGFSSEVIVASPVC